MADSDAVSIQMIAEKTGYSKATVSRVLRDRPGHSKKTREKILTAAKELNFTPHPIMSAVMSSVRFKKSSNFSPVIAEVHCQPWERKRGWNMEVLRQNVHAQAKALGYTIEEFNWFEPGMSPKRLLQIFKARGIKGIILEHFMESEVELDFDFNEFTVVSIGGALRKPKLHRVEINPYNSVLRTIKILRKRGYKRFGLVFPELFDKLSDFKRGDALYIANRDVPPEDHVPICYTDDSDNLDHIKKWMDTYSPDCIIGAGPNVFLQFESLGYRFPEDAGFAHLGWHSSFKGLAGINPHWKEIGIAAVNLVADQLNRNETGVPEHPLWVLIEGEWVEGETVRPPEAPQTVEAKP